MEEKRTIIWQTCMLAGRLAFAFERHLYLICSEIFAYFFYLSCRIGSTIVNSSFLLPYRFSLQLKIFSDFLIF